MYTKVVTATATATSLKDLMETGGHTFPNDNDSCKGLILQIDPATAAPTVTIMSEDETDGIALSTDISVGPPSISFMEYRLRNVYLKTSTGSIDVKVLVETIGG